MKRIKLFVLLSLTVFFFYVSNADAEKIDRLYEIAQKIAEAAGDDSTSWDRMAELCDSFGPRFVGSENLEKALDWCYAEMKKDGPANVTKEEVTVYKWVRGDEYCRLVEPWAAKIPCLTLGGSVATPPEGITAEVVVIGSKDELEEKKDEIPGKIVLFDEPYIGYGHNVQYRVHGADWASKYGALASMIRPTTHKSMQNPHTGVMRYSDTTVKKIPHFSLTDEACDLMRRLYDRGQKITVKLYCEGRDAGTGISYNVYGEHRGTDLADEIVAVGGHIDSWDAGIGTGAHDDAGPCVIAWEAVKLLGELNLKTRRTVRVVLWVDEEYRQTGGKQYAKIHGDEYHFGLLEFDCGIFEPTGMSFVGSDSLYKELKKYEPVVQSIADSFQIKAGGWAGVDIKPMGDLGYTTMGWRTNNDDYFIYHHSPLDTPESVDPKDINDNVAAMALILYIYANM